MPKKNIYDVVLRVLRESESCRNSDKKLIWDVLYILGYASGWGSLAKDDYMKAPSFESITRARRKVQELHPELRSTREVQEGKDKKESTKGTFIYKDNLFG